MTAQAALKSKDLPEVKKARAVIKGQLTTAVNRLDTIFGQKDGDEFDHKSISKSEVKQIEAKFNENFDLFQKLHQKCCEMRDVGKDDIEEEANVKKDEEYAEEVTNKAFPLLDQIVEYNRSLADFEGKKAAKKAKEAANETLIDSIPEKEKKYQKALDDFHNSKENAVQVAKCLEGIELEDLLDSSVVHIQPADSVKESLNKDFEGLAVRASDLTSALETRGDNPTDVAPKVKFDYSEELKEVGKLNLDLNKILEAKKINSDKIKSSSSQQILSSTFRKSSSTSKVSPIKINKPDPIKFSSSQVNQDLKEALKPSLFPIDILLTLVFT